MNEILYDIWFSAMLINRQDVYNKLVAKYGCSKVAFESFVADDLENFSATDKTKLLEKDISIAEKILKRCEKSDISVINQNSDYYPELLKYIDSAPAVLYCKGNLDKLLGVKITVIGSRQCDKDGITNANRFSKAFSNVGLTVVAGFAPGIEATIHKAVLSTIVIMPCGINITYPAMHFRLKNMVLDNGGLFITEYPFDVKAYKENFKYRNRLLAAISDATVFVQCGMKSGTAHTFNWTAVYGRDAYVIPGSINNIFYQGSNGYIKEGGVLITCPEDVLVDYFNRYPELIYKAEENAATEQVPVSVDTDNFEGISESEKKILAVLSGGPLHIDQILKETNLPTGDISVSLINLELLDIIEKCEGNIYKIK